MQPHQDRVIVERDALQDKISKLQVFFGGDIFKNLDKDDQSLLAKQYVHMNAYAAVLNLRIARFKEP